MTKADFNDPRSPEWIRANRQFKQLQSGDRGLFPGTAEYGTETAPPHVITGSRKLLFVWLSVLPFMVISGRIHRLLWLPLLQHGASLRVFSQTVSAKWNKSKIRKVDVVIGHVSSWYWKGGTATAQQFILEFPDHRGNHNSVEWQDRSYSSSSFSFSSSFSSNSSLSSSRKLTPPTCRRSHLYQQRF